ncbi:MAG TPA: DinB family protein [Herpetosiphonaceae bacterium]
MTSNLTQVYEKESGRIWSLIGGLSEHDLRRPIRDDGWSAFQIAAHLSTSTRGLTYLARVSLKPGGFQAQPGGPGSADFNLEEWNHAQNAEWSEKSLDELRAAWDETAKAFAAFVAGLSDADLDREISTPMGQQMQLSNLLSMITMHLRIHRQEIERGLAGDSTPIQH